MNRCTLCHHGTYSDKLVVISARREDGLLIVDEVPALVCDQCGDKIISEETAREVERVAEGEPAYTPVPIEGVAHRGWIPPSPGITEAGRPAGAPPPDA